MKISIKKRLENVLIHNGKMEYRLYEYELEEILEEMKLSLIKDGDDFIFAVTENNNDVAMLLIDKSGAIYINESARDKLKDLWKSSGVYLNNMKKLIPAFAKQLKNGEIPINGVVNNY